MFFASLPSRRLCGQCVGNPEKKKRNICMGKGKKPGRSSGTEDCHIVRLTI